MTASSVLESMSWSALGSDMGLYAVMAILLSLLKSA